MAPLPPARAASSASRAPATISSGLVPSTGKRAMPADTEMVRPSTAGSAPIARITRSATAGPPFPGATTTNSSPPMRATVSL